MKVFANQTVELVSEDGNTCDLSTKPTTSQDCHIANCGAKWHFTKWSTVSIFEKHFTKKQKKYLLYIKNVAYQKKLFYQVKLVKKYAVYL